MTTFFACVIPCIFLLSFLFALFKKVKLFDSFSEGAKDAIPLVVSIFPYIATVSLLGKLLEVSGLQTQLSGWLSPVFSAVGVPCELTPLLIVKPLSGSGAIAMLSQILESYGVDSYIARCACIIYGASDTIFYIGAVYFASLKRKKLPLALGIALFSYFLSIILGCFLCRIL